jgi:ABC-type lipoprotein release transport system permease subunit
VGPWAERQRHILDFTLSSLWRRKGKNGALLLVYTTVVFLLASVVFFSHALKREAASVLKGAPEIVVQRMVAGRHDLVPVGYAERIRGIRGVQNVTPRLWGYYYDEGEKANYTFLVPADGSQAEGTVSVGDAISRSRGAFPGDTLPFRTNAGSGLLLKVEAVLPRETQLASADLLLVSESDFRNLFGVPPGIATDLAVSVRNPQELTTVARKIAMGLPDTRTILRDEVLRTYDAVFSWRAGILLTLLAAALLAFVILGWDKASGLSAEERREIGILKAIGWETSDVLMMKVWEGATVSLTAYLAGVLLAYVHVFLGASALFVPVMKGWSVLYPDFRLVPFVSGSQLTTLFFLAVVPYTVATIVPSWRAATVDPDAVMR